jgi:hypothetical protein
MWLRCVTSTPHSKQCSRRVDAGGDVAGSTVRITSLSAGAEVVGRTEGVVWCGGIAADGSLMAGIGCETSAGAIVEVAGIWRRCPQSGQ